MSNIALRDTFWSCVFEKAKTDSDIIIVSADMGAPSLDQFRRDIPGQFVNVGIAEQNGLLIAAGLALEGKHVFFYGIAPFVTLRCIEQIRVECSIMNIPLTIVGVGAGFGYDDSGPTHHMIEDLSMMRAMPGITVNTITDGIMAQAVAAKSCYATNTNYVRLDREILPEIYSGKSDFSRGYAVLKPGTAGSIVSMGYMTHVALSIAEQLAEKNIDLGVIDLFRIPANEKHLVNTLQAARSIITLEEHFLPGGMGSYVLETLNMFGISRPVKRLGLTLDKGYCFIYGGRKYIHDFYKLDEQQVLQMIESVLEADAPTAYPLFTQ